MYLGMMWLNLKTYTGLLSTHWHRNTHPEYISGWNHVMTLAAAMLSIIQCLFSICMEQWKTGVLGSWCICLVLTPELICCVTLRPLNPPNLLLMCQKRLRKIIFKLLSVQIAPIIVYLGLPFKTGPIWKENPEKCVRNVNIATLYNVYKSAE